MSSLSNSTKRFGQQLARASVARAAVLAASQLRAAFGPQMAYMWDITFTDLFAGNSSEDLRFFAKESAIPATTMESITSRYLGIEYSHSGYETSPNTFRVTFFDNQGLPVYRYMQKWMQLSHFTRSGLKALPKTYQREIKLELKDSTDTLVTDSFLMIDAFPIEISETVLSFNNSDVVQFDVIFKFSQKIIGGK